MYQRRDGDGSLFQNKKQKDSHPDYRGEVQLDGKTYEIAGWKKSRQNGEPWLSLSVKLKGQREERQDATRTAPAPQTRHFDDSKIPF